MGGVLLYAVEKDGVIKWEPVDGIDSVASREAQRRKEQDEARSVRFDPISGGRLASL